MSTAKKVGIIVVIAAVVVALGLAGFAWAKKGTQAENPTKSATVLVNGLKIENESLTRGTTLTVTGTQGDYYQATLSSSGTDDSTQEATVLVPKSYVRLSSEATPDAWAGYASEGAKLYKTVALSGTELATLEKDAEVTVEDSFAGMLYVKTADGTHGYVAEGLIQKEKSEEESADETQGSTANGTTSNYANSGSYYSYTYDDGGAGYSSGGDAGGSSGSGSSGSSSGAGGSSGGGSQTTTGDGGDISLNSVLSAAAKATLGVQVAEAATTSPSASAAATSMNVSATVLGDGVMSYLGIFNRGDVIQVRAATSSSASASPSTSPSASSSTSSAETVEAVFGDTSKPIEKRLVRIEGEAEYTSWTGYAQADAPLYSDYTLTTVAKTLPLNTELKIVDNLTSCYVVDIDGAYFYVANSSVSTLKAEEPKEETADAESAATDNASTNGNYSSTYSSSYYDGGSYDSSSDYSGGESSGSSGSSDSSGSSGTGSSGSSEEWTPAVL